MRLFQKITSVCQNCKYGNNAKGKRIKNHWNVFCEKKKKYYKWDKYKFCFRKKGSK